MRRRVCGVRCVVTCGARPSAREFDPNQPTDWAIIVQRSFRPTVPKNDRQISTNRPITAAHRFVTDAIESAPPNSRRRRILSSDSRCVAVAWQVWPVRAGRRFALVAWYRGADAAYWSEAEASYRALTAAAAATAADGVLDNGEGAEETEEVEEWAVDAMGGAARPTKSGVPSAPPWSPRPEHHPDLREHAADEAAMTWSYLAQLLQAQGRAAEAAHAYCGRMRPRHLSVV